MKIPIPGKTVFILRRDQVGITTPCGTGSNDKVGIIQTLWFAVTQICRQRGKNSHGVLSSWSSKYFIVITMIMNSIPHGVRLRTARMIDCNIEKSNLSHSYEYLIFPQPRAALVSYEAALGTLTLEQDGHHFADDMMISIFLKENIFIFIKITLKFVPMGRIINKSGYRDGLVPNRQKAII